MNWRHRAACLGSETELFFPVRNEGLAQAQVAEAKAICVTCPVRLNCLLWALNAGVDHGVWGGLSADERRQYKRRPAFARRPAHPVVVTMAQPASVQSNASAVPVDPRAS